MSFLYPSFLWALSVLAIPVIIHLFNFRRTTRIYFSNTRFLRRVKEASTAKRRLKHYFILFSRLLFLFFLVLVFAQPILPSSEQISAGKRIVLYLDNSHSMSAQGEEKRRSLDAAIGFARNIIDIFPPDTRYKLVTNDFAPFSNVFKTKTEIADLLTEIRFSPVTRSFREIRDRIYLEPSAKDYEIFLISDFQKSTLRVSSIQDIYDSLVRWHIVPLTTTSASNIFIDSAYLQNPFAIGEEKNSLNLLVRNDADKNIDQLNLKLTINDIQAATASVSIPPRGVAETSFDLATGISGLNRGHISFSDQPVNFDNDFYFTLNFTDKVRVIEIRTATASTPVESVFGNQQLFSYSGFSVGNFNYSLLDQADVVIVNGINTIDASLSLALRGYLDNSGSVLFIPGQEPDIDSYRNFLGIPSMTVAEAAVHQELDRPDFDNPFFENVFEEKTASLVMPKARRVLSWGNDRSAILRFRDDQPFLSLIEQTGKIYLLASPLQGDHTDFFNHALFVPVMYRFAASSKKATSKPYYTLEENFITLHVDSLMSDEPLRLVGDQEIVPAQRKVGDRVLLDIPKFSMTQGFYNVVVNRDTVDLLAFNLDKNESLLDQYSGDEVKNLLGGGDNITIFEAGSGETFSNEIKARYLGRPLWKYALLLSLLFLLAEILLIRFMK